MLMSQPPAFSQDFYNLVDVYLDAVFFPNCVRDPRTFAQEGWHYELEQPEVPLPCTQMLCAVSCQHASHGRINMAGGCAAGRDCLQGRRLQ